MAESGRYIVTIRKNNQREVIVDSNTFLYGNWKEIGYWLDYRFYNGPGYFVEIEFQDHNPFSN